MSETAYERKQRERRERYKERAEAAEKRSQQSYEGAKQAVAGIPFGQPILVGHHSEKRHRAAIRRSDNRMRKSVEEADKAKYYKGKAAAVGTGGISADDPDAIIKLAKQLEEAEQLQDWMKRFNAAWRKAKKPAADKDVFRQLAIDSDLPPTIGVAASHMASYDDKPYPSYKLTNNNANIRRLKDRIAELERQDSRTDREEEFEDLDLTICWNSSDNRIQLVFDGKPPENVRAIVKGRAFKWARSLGVWQRQWTDNAEYATKQLITELRAL